MKKSIKIKIVNFYKVMLWKEWFLNLLLKFPQKWTFYNFFVDIWIKVCSGVTQVRNNIKHKHNHQRNNKIHKNSRNKSALIKFSFLNFLVSGNKFSFSMKSIIFKLASIIVWSSGQFTPTIFESLFPLTHINCFMTFQLLLRHLFIFEKTINILFFDIESSKTMEIVILPISLVKCWAFLSFNQRFIHISPPTILFTILKLPRIIFSFTPGGVLVIGKIPLINFIPIERVLNPKSLSFSILEISFKKFHILLCPNLRIPMIWK